MKKIYLLCLTVVMLFLYNSCQKDDICPETTVTTPKLVIVFKNNNNKSEVKSVHNLNVKAIGESEFYFNSPVNDTIIKIPLRTTEDITGYEFYVNTNDSDSLPRLDEVHFNYARNDIFVSRACGYKVNFIEFNANKQTSNWIKSMNVQQPNDIVNENTAHLIIYH